MLQRTVTPEDVLAYVGRVTESCARQGESPAQAVWALRPETTALLTMLIHEHRPASVLEFGAGQSSVAIASALAKIGGGRLTSIDHDPQYCRDQWALVQSERLVDARLVEGGLGLRLGSGGLFYSFTGVDRAIASRGPFDLVLIDGPPAFYGRDATLHLAWSHLSPGAVILLDDYRRSREQHTVRRWMSRYKGLTPICLDPAFARGIAVLRHDHGRLAHSWLRAYVGSFVDLYRFRGMRQAWK